MKYTVYCIIIISIISCSRRTVYQSTEIECFGSASNDGSIQLKIWSYGMSQFEAINTAKMKAVDAILFKGISMGNAGCPSNPIINDLSLKERERKFFNNFYEKNGAFNQFVTLSGDGSISPKDRFKVAGKIKLGVYVVVNHRGLKAYMEKIGYAKKLTTGF